MKTLYFDCGMGAAGDMLMASLYEICPDKAGFLKTMNEMGVPGLFVEAEPAVKCGITGTHMKVTIHGEEEESVDVDLQGHEHEHHQEHNHAPRGPEVGRGVSNPPSLPLDSTLPATS